MYGALRKEGGKLSLHRSDLGTAPVLRAQAARAAVYDAIPLQRGGGWSTAEGRGFEHRVMLQLPRADKAPTAAAAAAAIGGDGRAFCGNRTWDLTVLLHKSLCTYHFAICADSGVVCA